MYARRTESLDTVELQRLINQNTELIFGKRNLNDVIEKAILSVTLTTYDNEIIGYASFYDYPNVADIDSASEWNEHVSLSGYEMATSLNSLFIHYFISQENKESTVLMEIITTVFNTAPEVHYIFMNSPSSTMGDKFLSQFNKITNPKSMSDWYGIKRESYMPRLYIRPAKAEDQDDLAPIFNAQTDVLTKIYGEFYIAEMIAAQSDTMKCLVAEVTGAAIGFMSVTSDSKIDLLDYAFFLEQFKGFKKVVAGSSEDSKTTSAQEYADDYLSPSFEHSVPVPATDIDTENSLASTSTLQSAYVIPNQLKSRLSMNKKAYTNVNTSELPAYPGEPSVITIQLFAINEAYEMRSLDFLLEVFKLFPTKDYILITVPHLVPEFTLLENFVRIIPRPGIILPHELYAFHKGGLISNFRVRAACQTDQESIVNLINTLSLSHHILQDLEQFHSTSRYDDGIKLYAYVAECLDQVVGVAVIKNEEDIEYIRSHYNIEDFIYFTQHMRHEHAHIKHFVLNPVFKRLSKTFIKEVMRKSKKTSFYFPIYKPWAPKKILDSYSLPTIITDMVPVRPRRQIVYDLEKLENNAPTERILRVQEGYCLMHINRKLIMEPKLTINAKIVVVGASTTGLSFLESLVFCPHLKFNNLFLVSPHGLPDNYDDNDYIEQLMGKNFHFSKKKLEFSALRIQVNVVRGHMTAIDRKKKLITIDDKLLLPYDHLIVTTGLQYTIPCPTDLNDNIPAINRGIVKESERGPNRRYSEMVFKSRIDKNTPVEKKLPQNLFTVNDPFDALAFLDFVKIHLHNDGSNVIIYGHSFETYCCIHTLLDMGIAGYRIHYIKPPSVENNNPLNNPVVEEAVYTTLREAGVNVYSNYTLSQFNYSNEVPTWVTAATFTISENRIYIECKMFISYFSRVVNYSAFRAMNDSCLVFDARLVIDSFFHTNDLSIRAAGPVTKFKRRYYSDQWNHSKFSSKVVGEELSKVFLRLFDPTVEPTVIPPKEEVPLIPFYHDPIIRGSILPGGYYYLDISKPNLGLSLAEMMAQSTYGSVLTTGHPQSEKGYFRLHLDQYNKAESVTCLRKKPFPVENYVQLYGIHERALNNLRSRFDEGLIHDLFDFFDDTWAVAFYHDRFKDLKEELTELLMTRPANGACKQSLEETIRALMASGSELTADQRKDVADEYRLSGAKTAVDQRLIGFIGYNYYHLPMYAKPDLV